MKAWKFYLIIAVVLLCLEIGVAYKAQTLVTLIPLGLGSLIFFIMFIVVKLEYPCYYSPFASRPLPDKEKIRKEIDRAKLELSLSNNELEKAALRDMIVMREKYLR